MSAVEAHGEYVPGSYEGAFALRHDSTESYLLVAAHNHELQERVRKLERSNTDLVTAVKWERTARISGSKQEHARAEIHVGLALEGAERLAKEECH